MKNTKKFNNKKMKKISIENLRYKKPYKIIRKTYLEIQRNFNQFL